MSYFRIFGTYYDESGAYCTEVEFEASSWREASARALNHAVAQVSGMNLQMSQTTEHDDDDDSSMVSSVVTRVRTEDDVHYHCVLTLL